MPAFVQTRDDLAEKVFNTPYHSVERAVLENTPITETTLGELTDDLAEILGIGKTQTVGLLGVSASTKSRSAKTSVDPDVLDRAIMTIDVFARVATILGTDSARAWFDEPKRALGGARPLDLLKTRVGMKRLDEVLTALEDGAYL
jgi:putative toxin-antitoxin system antitoxin component (TIGR02293 family)